MKTLGVLGGMGPAATVDFLAKLQAATPAARDQDHIRVLIDLNPQVPDRNVDAPAAEAALAAMAAGLKQAGAEVLAMPCNTAHAHAAAIEACGLPLINMIDSACEAAQATGARRIGLIGTGTAAELYAARLEALGLDAAPQRAEDQATFKDLLYRIKGGDLGERSTADATALARTLVQSGAEAIIAGCTELPLVLKVATVPLIDPTWVLAQRCVAACRDG